MAVRIGSAHGDERGQAHGGQAGDQTGKEVSSENWYKSSKGWRVFRAKDEAAARKIALDMEMACANPHIGYDQWDRLTLWAIAEMVGFDCGKVETNCETDCSALVRVCCAFAGIMTGNFNTETEPGALLKTGAFIELEGPRYTDSSDRLRAGDILVTRTKGHTAVVLDDGPRAYEDEGTLRRGDKGEDVKRLQEDLLALSYDLGKWGADGDFGAKTEEAVKDFQQDHGLEIDGIAGPRTLEALEAALNRRYTVTIRGLSKKEAEGIRAAWPEAEVRVE